jgi:small-conductance mechanosensitive channel
MPESVNLETVNKTVNTWGQVFVNSFQQAFSQIIALAPRVLAMAVVLVAGYLVARLVAQLVAALSDRIGLPRAAERGGLVESMKHVGITRSVSGILGQIVFWFLMCVFLMAAFNILELRALSDAMQGVVAYIPRLLVATVVVVIGLLIANFLRGVIATSADRVGISYAERLATGCYYVLALMTFIAAFDQLAIKFALLEQMILIAFGSLAVGLGLAIGLGGREVAGGILAGYYTRQRLHAGDTVSVAGFEGTVREVGPVATIIETREEGLTNRHSIPNTKMLSEAVR